MVLIRKCEEENAKMKQEVDCCRMQFRSLENLRLDAIREELDAHEVKNKLMQKYVQDYVDAVQTRIDECEVSMKKYAAEMIMDSDQVQKVCRDYISQFFEQE